MRLILSTRNCIASLFIVASLALSICAYGQQDQGTIQVVSLDGSGAVIPNASVALTNKDECLVLTLTTDERQLHFFTPLKLIDYTNTAAPPSLEAVTQEHLRVNLQAPAHIFDAFGDGAFFRTGGSDNPSGEVITPGSYRFMLSDTFDSRFVSYLSGAYTKRHLWNPV